MVLVNDKVGSFKVIELIITGDAHVDLSNLIEQGEAFFWDLDQSIAALFAELPLDINKAIYLHGKAIWQGWDIFYITNKIFCVSYQYGANFKYYNLSQYFPDIENPGIDIAQRCADELEHALHIMGIWPKKMSSPAAIFEDYYGKHLDLPTFKHFGMEYSGLFEIAAACAGNEWNELFKLGYFENAYCYDRRSAYGLEMAQLIDNRPEYNLIKESSDYQPDADFGYCKCDIEIKSSVTLHPIPHIDNNGVLSYKTGSWRGKLTKGQMDFIKRWQIGDWEIINGWWIKTKKVVKPLEQFIPRVLAFKEHENAEVRFLAKTMVNGFGGKFNEEYKERVGDLYNPMWSAEIITRNAMKVCETIYRNKCWDDIIQVKVDDFKTTKKLAVIPAGWKESSGELLAATPENVFFGNQHPSGLGLEEALSMLREHPRLGYYEKITRDVVTLAEAQKSKMPKNVGREKDKIITIDLYRNNVERDFGKLPLMGGELLDNIYKSKPYFVEEA